MRTSFLALLLASSTALAQPAPPSNGQVLKDARRISDLMKQGEKPASQPVKLTPPDQLFTQHQARMLYALPRNKPADYQAYLRFVLDEQLFQEALETVNGLAGLPRDMFVIFADCGQSNAFYDPRSNNITMCFELVRELDELYAKQAVSRDEAKELIRGALFFVFFHEFGHALTHEFDLPMTGDEEDAVDRFATLLLLEQGERGEQAALSGAQYFLSLALKPNANVFWDKHRLSGQRFFNIACWLYGASPFHQVNLVAKGLLPAPRAAQCGDEFQQMRRSWKRTVDPKLKRPLK